MVMISLFLLEITLELPYIRLQITPVEQNGSQCNEINEHMQHNQTHYNGIQMLAKIQQCAVQNQHIVHYTTYKCDNFTKTRVL